MSPFFRQRPRFDHPAFGPMEWNRAGSWTAELPFSPTGDPVLVVQAGAETGPAEWGGVLYEDLVQRYQSLEELLGDAVFQRYAAGGLPDGVPMPPSPREMMQALVLEYVGLDGPARVSLGFGLPEGAGWDDATITVALSDWRLAEVRIDD